MNLRGAIFVVGALVSAVACAGRRDGGGVSPAPSPAPHQAVISTGEVVSSPARSAADTAPKARTARLDSACADSVP